MEFIFVIPESSAVAAAAHMHEAAAHMVTVARAECSLAATHRSVGDP